MMRRKQSVLLIMISWTVLSFLASSFATFSKASSITSPCRGFCLDAENVFVFFPISSFQRKECHSGSTISIIAALHLLQALPGWRFLLPLALYSCLPFFFSFHSKLVFLLLFLGNNFPHLSYVLFFSHHYPQPSTMRIFLHKLIPLPLCQWFISFCHQ